MSFFKDFKDDLSLAVNELLPGEDAENEDELDDVSDMMVNTLEGELDIESELSKLDGLLEDVDRNEKLRHTTIELEEPVLELEQIIEPKTRPQPETRTRPQPEVKTRPQPEVKTRPQPEVKTRPQPETRTRPQPETRTRQQPEARTRPQPEVRTRPQPEPVPPVEKKRAEADRDSVLNRLNSVFDLKEEPEEEVHFSFDALLEETEPELRRTEEPVNKSAMQYNRNMNTSTISTTIKEEVPMNEEMAKEMAAVSMEEELSSVTPEITDEVSIITQGTMIKGNLSTTGSFSISGRVEGNVQCNGKLEITGTIKGNSSSSEVFSDAAKIEGEISSTGTVKIGLGSVVVGNITATSAVIAGAVKGDIDVQGPVVVDTSAVIVGNIKSRSVQINNGAVIEGFCSQCYADIDVESLFGDSKKGK